MALQSDIVYEAVKTGVSQGVFMVVARSILKTASRGRQVATAEIETDKANQSRG